MEEEEESCGGSGITTEAEDSNLVLFDPPLWKQRRSFVNEILRKSAVTSVLDFGCGEGSLMSFLVQPFEESPITRLAGVDINRETLDQAVEICRPWDHDYEFLRLTPLTIDIFQGSVDVTDKRLLGYDALVCMEVIEHLDPPVLDKFFDVVLGTYKPKVVIVTTPNVEFNIYFPQLKYGTPEATLRIDDHRFEWTRREFQEWGNAGAKKYNYSVEYTGVGEIKDGDPAIGTTTQIAIFRDLNPSSKPVLTSFGTYEHIAKIVFPYYDEPDKSYEEILEKIHYYLQFLCNRIIDPVYNNGQIYDPKRVKIEDIWDIHSIRQLCKDREKLRDVLSSSSDFTLINNDEVMVHKEYPLETDEGDRKDVEYHFDFDYDYSENTYEDEQNRDTTIYDNYSNHDYNYDENTCKEGQNWAEQSWVTTTTTTETTDGWPNYNDYNSNGWKIDDEDGNGW